MLLDLIAHRDYLRILTLIRAKPRRFTELRDGLKLNPTQVNRALVFLRKEKVLAPRPGKSKDGHRFTDYVLSKRGQAFMKCFQRFCDEAKRRKSDLGPSAVAELRTLDR